MKGRSKSSAGDRRVRVTEDADSVKVDETAAGPDDDSLHASMFIDTLKEDVRPSTSRVVQDDEERELQSQLDDLERERRKAKLRAALSTRGGDSSDDSDSGHLLRSSRRRRRRKTSVRATSNCSTTSTSSPSSKSESSCSSDSSKRHIRRTHKKKKHSKFSLHGFTKNKKSVKKLSFPELMYAALLWGVKRGQKVGMSSTDLQAYMGHLCYLSMHATSNTFTDEAFRGYDRAIRERAKERGVRAFKMGDNNISLLHFNLDNSKALRESKRFSASKYTQRDYSKPKRGLCYAYNFNRDGCKASECKWEHKCVNCKSKDHIVSACPGRKN